MHHIPQKPSVRRELAAEIVPASRPTEHWECSGNQASSGSEPKRILTAPPPSPRLPTLNPSSTAYPAAHDPVEDGWHDFLEWRDFVSSVQQGRDAWHDDAESSYGYDSGFRQEVCSSQSFKNGYDDGDGGENDDPIVSWLQLPRDTLARRPRTGHRHRPRAYSPQHTVGQRSASDPACLVHGGSPLRQVMHAGDLVSVGSAAAWVSERCEVGPRGSGGDDGVDGGTAHRGTFC